MLLSPPLKSHGGDPQQLASLSWGWSPVSRMLSKHSAKGANLSPNLIFRMGLNGYCVYILCGSKHTQYMNQNSSAFKAMRWLLSETRECK